MKGLVFFFLFIIPFAAHGQLIPRYTYHDDDRQHLKEVYHVEDTFTNVLQGPYLSYYLNGNIESKGQFIDNETAGVWEFYYETGDLKMRGALKNNSNHGVWEYFYENGNKQMEGEIINGKREGIWRTYYETGEIKSEGKFVNNRYQGPWKFYYIDGKVKGEGIYKNGYGSYTEYYLSGEKKAEGFKNGLENTGKWIYYYKKGNKQAEGVYDNGILNGDWAYFYEEGGMSSEGKYINDEPQGDWKYYHVTGELSAQGNFEEGEKTGTWKAFFPSGNIKSITEHNVDMGSADFFKEYYKNGQLKAQGNMMEGIKDGSWYYYYPDGKLQGEVDYARGKGEYTGYFPDGSIQTEGMIEDDQRVGTWKIFDKKGNLKGYYRPFYESDTTRFEDVVLRSDDKANSRKSRSYGVADYGFKKNKFNYFKPKINEFKGLIISANPLTSLIGRFPVSGEIYFQERLGYELYIEGIRDPFFTRNDNINTNSIYTRGYSFSIRQKFYNPDNNFGLLYFGHGLDYINKQYFVNELMPDTQELFTESAREVMYIYRIIVGYRLMESTHDQGFTLDGFIGLGTGYRNFTTHQSETSNFDTLSKGNIPLDFNFGLTFGYVKAFGKRR